MLLDLCALPGKCQSKTIKNPNFHWIYAKRLSIGRPGSHCRWIYWIKNFKNKLNSFTVRLPWSTTCSTVPFIMAPSIHSTWSDTDCWTGLRWSLGLLISPDFFHKHWVAPLNTNFKWMSIMVCECGRDQTTAAANSAPDERDAAGFDKVVH